MHSRLSTITALRRGSFTHRLQQRIELAIELLLVAVPVFAVLAFEGYEAWSEAIVHAGIVLMLLLWWASRMLAGELSYARSKLNVLATAMICLMAVQILPLPRGLVELLNPKRVQSNERYSGPEAGSIAETARQPAPPPRTATLSVYPAAGISELTRAVAYFVYFFVGLSTVRHYQQLKRIATAMFVFAVAVAIVAIVQKFVGSEHFYWTRPEWKNWYVGPFRLKNRFAGFCNMAIGLGVGLILLLANRNRVNNWRLSWLGPRLAAAGVENAAKIWMLVAATALLVGCVLMSYSRGGMLSLFAAMSLTLLVLSIKRATRPQGWVLLAVCIAAVAVAGHFGWDALAKKRLMTLLQSPAELQRSIPRLQQWRDSLAAVADYPVTGSGAGTYWVVYPAYKSVPIQNLFQFAENEYLQLLCETGPLGLAIGLAMVVVVLWHLLAGYRAPFMPRYTPLLIGLGVSVTAMLLQIVVDFPFHRPASALTFMLMVVLLVATSRRIQLNYAEATGQEPPLLRRHVKGGRATLLTVAVASSVGIAAWMQWMHRSAVAERNWWDFERLSRRYDFDDKPNPEKIQAMKLRAEASLAEMPTDIERLYCLGFVWTRLIEQKLLHNGLMVAADDEPLVVQARNWLRQARQLCPLFGPAHLQLGRLAILTGNTRAAQANLQRAMELEPSSSPTIFTAASFDLLCGRIGSAQRKLRRVLELDGTYCRRVMTTVLATTNDAASLLDIVPDDARMELAAGRFAAIEAKRPDIAEKFYTRAIAHLQQQLQAEPYDAQTLQSLGSACAMLGRHKQALDYYARALSLKYEQLNWRLEYARELVAAMRYKQAMQQVRICLRIQPSCKPAIRLQRWLAAQLASSSSTDLEQ